MELISKRRRLTLRFPWLEVYIFNDLRFLGDGHTSYLGGCNQDQRRKRTLMVRRGARICHNLLKNLESMFSFPCALALHFSHRAFNSLPPGRTAGRGEKSDSFWRLTL